MKHVALLGAGFSYNWGGWLANEAFEYLIGTPEADEDPGLRELLWRYQDKGGFEDALAHLQAELSRHPLPAAGFVYMGDNVALRSQAGKLQGAVTRMFDAMNAGYNSKIEMEPTSPQDPASLLARFDAIFTLNQDMLLERLYARRLEFLATEGGVKYEKGWRGATLPGMNKGEKVSHSNGVEWWSEFAWAPRPKEELPRELDPELQPIYKLHGSSQWSTGTGMPMLVIGGEKSRSIKQFPILEWYAECFDSWLAQSTRLMVIGYGFRDQHINEALLNAESSGLKLFIVDPGGPSVAAPGKPPEDEKERSRWTQMRQFVQRTLVGASRRNIIETMARDPAERAKILRFFES